jgi:electron transport complex protein RnfD
MGFSESLSLTEFPIMKSSPYTRKGMTTAVVMRWVLVALLPGFLLQWYFFGWGYLVSLIVLCSSACGFEAMVMALRKRPIFWYLKDSSALVTAVLLAIALPPFLPWWMYVLAAFVAVVLGKQLYGGLGFNPFNPAMLAYAFLLVSYPVSMTIHWALPRGLVEPLGLHQSLSVIFGEQMQGLDAFTGATPLDLYKTQVNLELADVIWKNPIFGEGVALGWEWIAIAYLCGGLLLLWKKVIGWHIPVGVIFGCSVMAMLFGWDPDRQVPIYLHWFGGSLFLGAFFIATDPVSAPTTVTGKWIFGVGVGVLIYVIRTWGNYPDAVAFSVLLMNLAAPFIDQYTQPRTFGHKQPKRGLIKMKPAPKDTEC